MPALAALFFSHPAHAQAELGGSIREALCDYARFQSDISASLDARVEDEQALGAAIERAARYDPVRVSRGWVAYNALTAAQSPAFVRGVEGRVRAAGRAPVVRQLRRDATYARRRPTGSGEAIQRVLAATLADGARGELAGQRYVRLVETWPADVLTSDPALREARTARLSALNPGPCVLPPEIAARLNPRVGETLPDAGAFGGTQFWDALAGRDSEPAPRLHASETQPAATNRMLTLAGLIIVGASASESARVESLLDEPHSRSCLTLELLQLRQCLSVSNGVSEDAHCLARHGLSGPGACLAAFAN